MINKPLKRNKLSIKPLQTQKTSGNKTYGHLLYQSHAFTKEIREQETSQLWEKLNEINTQLESEKLLFRMTTNQRPVDSW